MIKKRQNYPTIGADPEGFIVRTSDGKYIPAYEIVKGTKDKPLSLGASGYYMHYDNVAVEFNIPPSKTAKNFNLSIEKAKLKVRGMIGNDHKVVYKGTHRFPASALASDLAHEIGCSPDFDAYTGGEQRTPIEAFGDNYRYAGGHIHVGGNFQCPDFVAALFIELSVSVYSNIAETEQTKRAKWYGKPGIYRSTPYGIEYRTPSAKWVGQPDTAYYIAEGIIQIANWLIQSDARMIQKAFKQINWVKINQYVSGLYLNSNQADNIRSQIINDARKAGVLI